VVDKADWIAHLYDCSLACSHVHLLSKYGVSDHHKGNILHSISLLQVPAPYGAGPQSNEEPYVESSEVHMRWTSARNKPLGKSGSPAEDTQSRDCLASDDLSESIEPKPAQELTRSLSVLQANDLNQHRIVPPVNLMCPLGDQGVYCDSY